MNQTNLALDTPAESLSVTGKRWQFHEPSQRDILTLVQKAGLSELIARIVLARDINHETIQTYLNPRIKDSLPDPWQLKDMDKACSRLVKAIKDGETVAIFGDYDVDGATSSALLMRFFDHLNVKTISYIPDRIAEGYGPNVPAMESLAKDGATLCITVDCGTVSFEPIAAANKLGLDVIVIDHHLGTEKLPEAVAIINPNRLDEPKGPACHLAAVGVSFLMLVALTKSLKEAGLVDDSNTPPLLKWLDIVALGSVCDVMPLTGVNRSFVAQGIKVMKQRSNIGLAALSDVAGIDQMPSVYHLGFVFGPRINAGGRVGESSLGTKLLTTKDRGQADEIARKLNHYNAERQAIEAQVLEEAIADVEKRGKEQSAIFAIGEGWHPGVIGIVASRLKDKYHRPTAVIALENGVGKASARSISGVDYGSAVVAARQEELLVAGGGHAMAAGFTVEESKIDDFITFLNSRFAADVAANAVPTLKFDGKLTVESLNVPLLKEIETLAPYGVGNPEPRFVLENVYLADVTQVGDTHLRCLISQTGAKTLKAMAFRAIGTPLGDALLQGKGKQLSIAGKAKLNVWQGRESAEFFIDDVMF